MRAHARARTDRQTDTHTHWSVCRITATAGHLLWQRGPAATRPPTPPPTTPTAAAAAAAAAAADPGVWLASCACEHDERNGSLHAATRAAELDASANDVIVTGTATTPANVHAWGRDAHLHTAAAAAANARQHGLETATATSTTIVSIVAIAAIADRLCVSRK